jgi:hypothetical protein
MKAPARGRAGVHPVCTQETKTAAPVASSNGRVRFFDATHAAALLWVLSALVLPPARVDAAQQADAVAPLTIDRLRAELEKPPPPRLRPKAAVPLRPTFKTRAEGRPFVPTLEEHLHKQFDLTLLQRQSAEWAARCCGFDLGLLVEGFNQLRTERTIRKAREQIARELAAIDAARQARPDAK